jgi:predicted RNase H-like nuclease
MKKQNVELNGQEWGQVLDGLACRVALYEETVGYYEHGVSYGHIAEVNDADEAQVILNYYRQIIGKIKKQLGTDGYIKTTEDLRRNIS